MTTQQLILLAAFFTFAVFFFYKRWKMGGNKVKLKEMLKNGAKVIDVRSRGEYATSHFPGSINIPLDELQSQVGVLGAKNEPLIVYCASGMRSGSAQRFLISVGFLQVENGVNQSNLQSL
jgi:phage shock protein E